MISRLTGQAAVAAARRPHTRLPGRSGAVLVIESPSRVHSLGQVDGDTRLLAGPAVKVCWDLVTAGDRRACFVLAGADRGGHRRGIVAFREIANHVRDWPAMTLHRAGAAVREIAQEPVPALEPSAAWPPHRSGTAADEQGPEPKGSDHGASSRESIRMNISARSRIRRTQTDPRR